MFQTGERKKEINR